MSILAPLLALAVTAVVPEAPMQDLIVSSDYPGLALMDRRGGAIGYRMTISSEGAPIRCEFMHTNATKSLGEHTCALLMKRARFTPAIDQSGKASAAVYEGAVNWKISGRPLQGPRIPNRTDIELKIARMPSGLKGPAKASVAVAVDSEGRVSDCSPRTSWPTLPPVEAATRQRAGEMLGRTACASALSILKPRPALDEKGQPIPSIQTANISFDTEPPGKR